MSKTTRPAPEARAFVTGRVSPEDLARARPVSELLRQVDELSAEQESSIRETALKNGTDPVAVFKRWNSQTRGKRA